MTTQEPPRVPLAELREEEAATKAAFRADPYTAGVALVLNKPMQDVTPDERQRFKAAFFRAFATVGVMVIGSMFEEMEQMHSVDGPYGPGGLYYKGPHAEWYREQAAQEKAKP
jgi:hypothetical protein